MCGGGEVCFAVAAVCLFETGSHAAQPGVTLTVWVMLTLNMLTLNNLAL